MTRKLAEFHQRRIAATLPLRERVSLTRMLAQIEAATQQFWQDSEAEARIQGVKKLEGRTLHLILKRHKPKSSPKTGRMASAGAPRKEALRAYVAALVAIYERATGQRIVARL